MSDDKMFLTDRQLRTLAAVCDTLVPGLEHSPDSSGFYRRTASDLNVPRVMARTVSQVASPDNISMFALALDLLDQPVINALFGGTSEPFAEMSLARRTEVLQSWGRSRLDLRRRAFQGFKRLALYLYYGILDEEQRNPNWAKIGYPGPAPVASLPARTIQPLVIDQDTTLSADVVIVGSGAGGGVVAGELAAVGLDVIVLEKGGYYAEPDFDRHEVPSGSRMFERQGLLTTTDLGVIVLAGSTLGGGTTVNWCASIRTPDSVLQEWQSAFGVTGYCGPEYQTALDAISTRINVNDRESAPNGQNAVLARGAESLSHAVHTIPRNVKGCQDCGFCNFGCPFSAKQSTLRTYLEDAYRQGARIVVQAQADRLTIQNGRATGLTASVQTPAGQTVTLTVKSRVVVASAGALHTPALLMRSGLTNANIGRNLHLHPTTGAFGRYADPVLGWSGVMMSRYMADLNNLDGRGYGVVMETAPVHPSLAASSLPWSDGAQHKDLMASLANVSNIVIITRDRDSGRITLDSRGNLLVHYPFSAHDRGHMLTGLKEALRMHRAAGAAEIWSPQGFIPPYDCAHGGDFEAFLEAVEAEGIRKNSLLIGSAHQMSSCRMGGNPAVGALDPSGESFEVRNLFVADGSVLPTASGVNPMITIMGVSYMIAQHIKARLKS